MVRHVNFIALKLFRILDSTNRLFLINKILAWKLKRSYCKFSINFILFGYINSFKLVLIYSIAKIIFLKFKLFIILWLLGLLILLKWVSRVKYIKLKIVIKIKNICIGGDAAASDKLRIILLFFFLLLCNFSYFSVGAVQVDASCFIFYLYIINFQKFIQKSLLVIHNKFSSRLALFR